MRILFFGCGGGRLNAVRQFFSTAGFLIDCSKKIYVDPGPSVAVQFRKFEKKFKTKITDIEGIFVSHAHLDHINDLEVVIEGMTNYATEKKGFLIAEESIFGKSFISLIAEKILRLKGKTYYEELKDEGDWETEISPSFSNYHKNLIDKIYKIKKDKRIELDDLVFYGTETRHDIEATGFVLEDKNENLRIGYTGDTDLFDGIEKYYKNCDAIVVNVLRVEKDIPGHFTIEKAIKFLNLTKPKYALLTRFGGQFINANKLELKKKIERETGVETVLTYDGMEFKI